jgi:hypothetical protein
MNFLKIATFNIFFQKYHLQLDSIKAYYELLINRGNIIKILFKIPLIRKWITFRHLLKNEYIFYKKV